MIQVTKSACIVLLCVTAACGPRRVSLPTDPGTPLPEFTTIHAGVSQACLGVRTLTAELGLAGRARGVRLRGRVVAGFARPRSMRLEGVAPFGPPAFILVASSATATLLLPRDSRVVFGASADAILGALTGVTLGPEDLQAILTGCVVPAPKATSGRAHRNGWASLDVGDHATLFLQQVDGQWQLRAAQRDGWRVEYGAWQGPFPRSVTISSDAEAVDVTATISQLETNVDIGAEAFALEIPDDVTPMTVEELRQQGPLRGAP